MIGGQSLQIDEQRLYRDFHTAASFGETSTGAVHRPAFSKADIQVRQWLMNQALDVGLGVRKDALNNVIIGDQGTAPGVWTGSHLDTVPHGGKFDGALGAIVGFECVRRIHELGLDTRVPVRSIAFADEEGSYLGFLGSRGIWNGLADAHSETAPPLSDIVGWDGNTLDEMLRGAGGDIAQAHTAQLPAGIVERFIELHVEQGPRLESEGTNIGVVTSIVGVGRCVIDVIGRPDHAGTTPMDMREDALRAAAKIIEQLGQLPEQIGLPDAVVTCGQVQVTPGAVNVVPGEVRVFLDYRDVTQAGLDRLRAGIRACAEKAVAATNITFQIEESSLTPPVAMDTDIISAITASATQLGLSHRQMHSGAGHDTQVIANIAPVGMVFVPSHQGRSHSNLEHTEWSDVVNGANVLLNTLVHYATKAQP